jgi:hypothetical protein
MRGCARAPQLSQCVRRRNVRHLAGWMCEFDSPETPVLRFNLCVFAQLARGSRYGG